MFTRIMVPLDRSPGAEGALAAASVIAHAHQAELHLVLVQPGRMAATVPEPETAAECREYLTGTMERLARELRTSPGVAVTIAMGGGEPAIALANYAAEHRIQLIVMTTHGRTGWNRAWAGSVADDLMHSTTTPILMVRHDAIDAAPAMRKVLVAVEDGEQGRDAAITALDAFDGYATVIVLAQVVSPVPLNLDAHFPSALVLTDAAATAEVVAEVKYRLDQLAAAVRCGRKATVETMVEVAAPVFPTAPVAGMITDLATRTRADVVVLTTHERGWTRLIAASVADRVLAGTHCMLLVRHSVIPAEASLSFAIVSAAGELAL